VRTIETEIHIDASASDVWNVLTDFAAYPDWNPLLTEASGVPEEGERLRIRVEPPGLPAQTFEPRVLTAEPGERLVWKGRLLVPGLFDGRHEFVVEPTDEGVRFVQRETFSGLLRPLLLRPRKLERGFDAMNAALKARVEAGDAP
jgi:hypothetical protein